MYNENNLLFGSAEAARDSLRYIEGKKGSRQRKSVIDSEFYMPEKRNSNPYDLPDSFETIHEPYIISGHKHIGILSDIHIPYHSISSLTLAIEYLKKRKIDAVLLNGDIIDACQLSNFVKDPGARKFKDELESLKTFFDVLDKQLKCQIYFKLGNHEGRYEKFLFEKAKELVGIDGIEFSDIIKAKERGIKMIPDKQVMKLNSLNGIHGHEYKGGISTPVNIARGLYLRGKVSAFQGHNHASSSHTESDMNGKVTTTYSIGCLSELHPAYMPLNKWNAGFAETFLDENGKDFEFLNHTIYKNKVY